MANPHRDRVSIEVAPSEGRGYYGWNETPNFIQPAYPGGSARSGGHSRNTRPYTPVRGHETGRAPTSPVGMQGERTYGSPYSGRNTRNVWNMQTRRNPEPTGAAQWNKPINFDYQKARADTQANRQRVGFVPAYFGGRNPFGYMDKEYIPASQALDIGYLDDESGEGYYEKTDKGTYWRPDTYFSTNPEFKTFFPNEPDYAALAAMNEFEKSGAGIYDESASMMNEPGLFGYYTTQGHPFNLGTENPHLDPVDKRIAINLGEDIDEMADWGYGGDWGYPTTDRSYKDTALHEMKHHWFSGSNPEAYDLYRNYKGTDIDDPWHHEIHLGEQMFSPKMSTFGIAGLEEAQNFMKMHKLGKSQFLDSQKRTAAGFNAGGIAGLPGQWTPSMSESEEEEYNIRPLQLDPGIMSIEDLEDLFEEAGLDKSIIYKLINSGGLSQLVA